VTIAAVLAKLHARGAKVEVQGHRLRVVAPAGAVTEADLNELRRWKPQILERLKIDCFLDDASIPIALFHSRRLGRNFVLARDEKALEALTEAGRALPVLFFSDCEKLSGLGPADLAKILDIRQVFGPSASLAVEARLG
jgi:hypothetical protein